MNKENFRAYSAWIAVCIIWGTTYLAIRIGVEHIPPMFFAGIRWLVAGSMFLLILKQRGKSLPTKNDLKHITVMGLLMLGMGNGLVVVGEQYISSGLAALLITTVPFWIVGIESFVSKGPKLNSIVILGLVIGLAGVSLIFGNDWKDLLNTEYLFGVLSILGAVVTWSLGSVYSKYRKLTVHPLMSAASQMIIAGTAQIILGLILNEQSVINLHSDGLLALLYLILVGSIFGYGSYIYAIEHLPLSLVSTYAYINPIIALFLGWIVLNEKVNVFTFIAAAVIIAGVVILNQGVRKAKKRAIVTSP